MVSKPTGRPEGRPTTYKPEYCKLVVELGKTGASFAQMAVSCDAVRSTLQLWEVEHPEFSAAMARAREEALTYWETLAAKHMVESPGGDRLNHSLWSRSMAARFPNDYRENKRTEISGPDGRPLETKVVISTGVPDAEEA